VDGLMDSLSQATENFRGPPFAFANSQNSLEDSLGLVSALVVSRLNNSGRYVPAEDSTGSGELAYVSATRLGSGEPESYLLLLPPVATAAILIALMMMNSKAESASRNISAADTARSSVYSDMQKRRPYTESLAGLLHLGGALSPVNTRSDSKLKEASEEGLPRESNEMEEIKLVPDYVNVPSVNAEQERLIQDKDLARWMIS